MIFEVRCNGRTVMRTSDPGCIYGPETIRNMGQAGYKAYLDEKIYRPKKSTVFSEQESLYEEDREKGGEGKG